MLPLVPAYMALISGDIGGEAGESTDTGINRSLRVTRDTSLFVLGFGAVFVALGATATTLGQALFDNQA
ncbi:MAG: cytochrome c biogenesis protein CcdA [Euzebya sp.]